MEIREGRNKRKEDNLLVDVDKTAFSKGNTDTQTSGKKDRRKRWHERERERERETNNCERGKALSTGILFICL